MTADVRKVAQPSLNGLICESPITANSAGSSIHPTCSLYNILKFFYIKAGGTALATQAMARPTFQIDNSAIIVMLQLGASHQPS